MSEHCTRADIGRLAEDLNAGHREAATQQLNLCTVDLLNGSDYAKTMHTEGAQVLRGEPEASAKADKHFSTLAGQERALWQDIRETAQAANPAGLCQLTIVDGKYGPSPQMSGDKCN